MDAYEKALPAAGKILNFARDTILVNLRFLSVAMGMLTPVPRKGLNGFDCDGQFIYYDPVYLVRKYKEEPAFGQRMYLHLILHQIFFHSFGYAKVEQELWSLAADIAVENVILAYAEDTGSSLLRDGKEKRKLSVLKEEVSALTAEKLYRYFQNHPAGREELEELGRCFQMDRHDLWVEQKREEVLLTEEQWRKVSERVRAELKSFSHTRGRGESLEMNLREAVRDRYDYKALLQKFMVRNEDMQVNDDEFDYIYYTYGLKEYGNMPLVEPLEYKDCKKIREFVIALDTSASCRGEILQGFLEKTYSILKSEDTFFKQVNIHIMQCDSQVQKDTRIRSREEFDDFLAHEKLTGFGSTDFRPVFERIRELQEKGEFENLKGLIYFTDGYGVYPDRMPDYDVMFVFPDNGDEGPEVPVWAIRVVLDEDNVL